MEEDREKETKSKYLESAPPSASNNIEAEKIVDDPLAKYMTFFDSSSAA